MTSVTEKVKVEFDKMFVVRDRANVMFEKVDAERTSFVEKEKNYEDRLNKMGYNSIPLLPRSKG